ncbi:MAG: universal stress protein [Alphaproteobacteria bacterium]
MPLDSFEAVSKEEVVRYLDHKARKLKDNGSANVSPITLEGEPAAQIIDLAKRTADSLVVICSHGLSGVGRWVLASMAERVARHCVGPVLLVRTV